ncbi:MAG: GGDEF domain-containing protein [Janthinobacterium lividum]
MADFFVTQLDFIFFFYGLSFVLLGVVCLAIARRAPSRFAWRLLGFFGILHGAGEWLDLLALSVGDASWFAALRAVIMGAAFVGLFEFARLRAAGLPWPSVGRWIYLPIAAVLLYESWDGGVFAANLSSRYLLALPGALWTAAVLCGVARRLSGKRGRWAYVAACGFAVYGCCAGAGTPDFDFWPANTLDETWFWLLAGTPIQLIRGLAACLSAFAVWRMWGESVLNDASDSQEYSRYLRRQFGRMLLAFVAIFGLGWALTQYLGTMHNDRVRQQASGDLDILSSRLAADTALLDGVARMTVASSAVQAGFTCAGAGCVLPQAALRQSVQAASAEVGYLVDREGRTLMRVAVVDALSETAAAPDPSLLAATAMHRVVFVTTDGARSYAVAFDVRDAAQRLLGRLVLQKSLRSLEHDFARFNRAFVLADAAGTVILATNPMWLDRPLWPQPRATDASSEPSAVASGAPAFSKRLTDDSWITLQGDEAYIRLQQQPDWSLLLLIPVDRFFASRLLGILATLLVAVLSLIHLMGTERLMQDNMRLADRLALEARARRLEKQATTDALTGIFNRLKFNQSLVAETERAAREHLPLCALLYDIDHFKAINDAYGHPLGDQVLIEISQLVSGMIRHGDLLARWGGEEFVVLAPQTDIETARALAERLRVAVKAHIFVGGVRLSCSFGVASYMHGDDAKSLITRADTALYRAKTRGRDRVEVALQAG